MFFKRAGINKQSYVQIGRKQREDYIYLKKTSKIIVLKI